MPTIEHVHSGSRIWNGWSCCEHIQILPVLPGLASLRDLSLSLQAKQLDEKGGFHELPGIRTGGQQSIIHESANLTRLRLEPHKRTYYQLMTPSAVSSSSNISASTRQRLS